MTSEMPTKYWRNLPEAAAIPELIRTAQARTDTMVETPAFSPANARPSPNLPRARAIRTAAGTPLRQAAADIHDCRRCPLWEPATQPVFGEGPPDARIMFVGEQPGDQEDLAGRPFVGPAGQLFDRAMAEAGLDRTPGLRHQRRQALQIRPPRQAPHPREARHLRDRRLQVLARPRTRRDRPALTVMMGATAARAVLGRAVTITRERGRPIPLEANRTGFITVHPSYLLRLPDEDAKAREYQAFVDDLRAIAALAA